MKQIKYNEKQRLIISILNRFQCLIQGNYGKEIEKTIEEIKKEYNIEPPFLTLREYLYSNSHGAYVTFHFELDGKFLEVDSITDFLDPKLMHYLPYVDKYYVVRVAKRNNGGDCTSFHGDEYLRLEIKED